ncbi:MAG: hypothetical protein HYW33_04095 [Candidatus Blackburnbacteria bacterium]|nr:hypothetical protein [Candidatus Blackburnbacteria bacterium]
MKSRWAELKSQAIVLRKKGASIRDIEIQLGIPRSTLSGWLRDVKLSDEQKSILLQRWNKALTVARERARLWHNSQKAERLKIAEQEASTTLLQVETDNRHILELALAMLYLGEGFKTQHTGMGNSDPRILKFFIAALVKVYNFDVNKIRCELHLRADQDSRSSIKYWSRELKIPSKNFTGVVFDKRTLGRATYPTYKGVCVVRCGNIAFQRRLVYLSRQFCDIITSERTVSSVGRASD